MSLPELYTIQEVAAATKYKVDTISRKLKAHPEIERVGSGRGLRLSLDAYRQLLKALTCSDSSPQDGEAHSMSSAAATLGGTLRNRRARGTGALLKDLKTTSSGESPKVTSLDLRRR